eukprot:CAMPEP_0197825984 /NCGR_PEP_ID=MMETSP1437-20131217/3005_1 /TAXON_ID=49252 ORGANISM="Eucampia antarctica, Strain CCMP1452" /NCGR_SAMPLE_ID=MMETSP1437 /ASSEMBLY_ACC=CAM_ASM_001096 /LENGTH=314 /DNA_ID=CAMNT_0043426219 /DNA_START=50 /DNA_END=994 /DNA_ORIENTATION=-
MYIEGNNSMIQEDGFLHSNARMHMNLAPFENEAEQKLAKSRERNREHARCTRLRKKAQLQGLLNKLEKLQAESQMLKQTLDECKIASILLGLSSGDTCKKTKSMFDIDLNNLNAGENSSHLCLTGKRKRFVSDASESGPQPMKLVIKGKTTLVGGSGAKAHINWKTGVYVDEAGTQKQLSSDELDKLRRERNRMHAKMTRDRKRNFVSTVNRSISDLELENKQIKEILKRQAQDHLSLKNYIVSSSTVDPVSAPGVKRDSQHQSLLLHTHQGPLQYPPAFVSFLTSPSKSMDDISKHIESNLPLQEARGINVMT